MISAKFLSRWCELHQWSERGADFNTCVAKVCALESIHLKIASLSVAGSGICVGFVNAQSGGFVRANFLCGMAIPSDRQS
jgi:hypothetical protein